MFQTGPPGPAGECIYQPVCPESAAIDSNPSSCSATAGESCACGKDCACNKENIYSESANIGTEPSHIFLTKPAGIIAIHSQSTLIPACPLGQNKLWEGFSLMRIETNGISSNFDLGSSGSCVRSFMPSVSATCDIEGQCKSGQRNDRTYWLLANGTVGSEPMTQEVARGIVSRCVVCDVPSAIVAIHSQSIEIPKCPAGWDDMWFGYSYLVSVPFSNQKSSINHVLFHPRTHHWVNRTSHRPALVSKSSKIHYSSNVIPTRTPATYLRVTNRLG